MLTGGGLVTVHERNSGVYVFHGCFLEGGDSIIKCLLLGDLASEAARQLRSFSG